MKLKHRRTSRTGNSRISKRYSRHGQLLDDGNSGDGTDYLRERVTDVSDREMCSCLLTANQPWCGASADLVLKINVDTHSNIGLSALASFQCCCGSIHRSGEISYSQYDIDEIWLKHLNSSTSRLCQELRSARLEITTMDITRRTFPNNYTTDAENLSVCLMVARAKQFSLLCWSLT